MAVFDYVNNQINVLLIQNQVNFFFILKVLLVLKNVWKRKNINYKFNSQKYKHM